MSQRRGTRMLARVLSHMRVICEKKRHARVFVIYIFYFFFPAFWPFIKPFSLPAPGPLPSPSFYFSLPNDGRRCVTRARRTARKEHEREPPVIVSRHARTNHRAMMIEPGRPTGSPHAQVVSRFFIYFFFSKPKPKPPPSPSPPAPSLPHQLFKKKGFHAYFHQHGHH